MPEGIGLAGSRKPEGIGLAGRGARYFASTRGILRRLALARQGFCPVTGQCIVRQLVYVAFALVGSGLLLL